MKSILEDEEVLQQVSCAIKGVGGGYLHYRFRNCSYAPINLVKIKTEKDEWVQGLSYCAASEFLQKDIRSVYVRPLTMFPEDKWEWDFAIGG